MFLTTCSTGILPNEHYMRQLEGIDFALAFNVPTSVESFDGLLILGGYDPDPMLYGQSVINDTVTIDARRDALDIALIHAFSAAQKPIFGICRGIQIINVALGGPFPSSGTLVQDMPSQLGLTHSNGIMHTVTHTRSSTAHRLWGDLSRVNSYHHQAVDMLAPGLRGVSICYDGTIEAIEHEMLPIFAVQWHPERHPWQPEFFDLLRVM
ncbi:MAG: gamma-glutamyl-gamma-aminobutyrate hydrolase family protein [Oscillospiraceae bacterium]|nr:gamma-glutamyl-gamma-aminobutyrate hydrolase family protein [Oscillospiraceae bacterium]